ncbi:MAG: hypothetical protein AAFQ66_19725 [Pseudomonadota bacterium]
MRLNKTITMTSMVCLAAFATGFLMQNGEGLFHSSDDKQPEPTVQTAAITAPELTAQLSLQGVEPLLGVAVTENIEAHGGDPVPDVPRLPGELRAPVGPHSSLSFVEKPDIPIRPQVETGLSHTTLTAPFDPTEPCTIDFTAKPSSYGMIDVQIKAPCYGDTQLEIAQGQLRYSARTDVAGYYSEMLPALAVSTSVSVAFADGWTSRAKVEFSEAFDFTRVALAWRGSRVMQLSAMENRAEVSRANPGAADLASGETAGFLTTLGDPSLSDAWQVEIYSIPQQALSAIGKVDMSIQAEVTPENCGRNRSAYVLQPGFDQSDRPTALTVAMPGCHTAGRTVVLDHVLRDIQFMSH